MSSNFMKQKLQLDVKPIIENLPGKFGIIEKYFKQQPYRANDCIITQYKTKLKNMLTTSAHQ